MKKMLLVTLFILFLCGCNVISKAEIDSSVKDNPKIPEIANDFELIYAGEDSFYGENLFDTIEVYPMFPVSFDEEQPVFSIEMRDGNGKIIDCYIENGGWSTYDGKITSCDGAYFCIVPVGDYNCKITCTWLGKTKSIEFELHRLPNLYGEPMGIGGVESRYTIKPGETITVYPCVLPEGWRTPNEEVSWNAYVIADNSNLGGIYNLSPNQIPYNNNSNDFVFSPFSDNIGFSLKANKLGTFTLNIAYECERYYDSIECILEVKNEELQNGDCNGDGVVDGRDLLRLARYIAGTGVDIDAVTADLNGDGSIDGRDVLRLAKQLAGS